MNAVTVLIGVACVAYGGYTAWAHQSKPETFRKLGPMMDFWGPKAGFVIHVVGYTVMPIVWGICFIIEGVLGAALF